MMKRIVALSLASTFGLAAAGHTRGPGVYPGAPHEYSGPALRPGGTDYRNLALHRPAYHSSAYDYNLTAQLATDGIKETVEPRRLTVATSDRGTLPMSERETLFDGNWVTAVDVKGPRPTVRIGLLGGPAALAIDRVDVDSSVKAAEQDLQNWTLVLSASADGRAWREVKRLDGMARPTGELKASLRLDAPVEERWLRLELLSGRTLVWHVAEIGLFHRDRPVQVAGPHNFTSAWMPAAGGEQWLSVDLGAASSIERVAPGWIRRPTAGRVEVSEDGASWKLVQALPAGPDVKFAQPVNARWVRLSVNCGAAPESCILSEFEVYGRGGMVAEPKAAAMAAADGRLPLAGGAWRLQRDSLVRADGRALSTPGFADRDWLVATVPGTVLASYLNAGAIPDPNFGGGQLMVSDSFFHADFWYRNEFTAPAASGRRQWLNFDGINWKAEVYLNGRKLGRIEGGFLRARFDVTGIVHPGAKNALAVRIEKNRTPGIFKEKSWETPGVNGGALGADNPTFHASIGWDWIPTIHGREAGIWNEVSLSASGPVTVDNPYVRTVLPLPDVSRADVNVEAVLHNHGGKPVTGVLRGRFGEVSFEQSATIAAASETTVKLSPATHPALRLANPKLWWPNGYGDAHLYPVELRFEVAGQVSDAKRFQTGVRQLAYSEDGGALKIWINGRRFIPRGGNWGFGESMLRYRAREYDAAVRYHREMNFTMIRNWVGQIGEDAFYEACDRHGIVVWQDFWLANPWDGPDPDGNAMFLNNVRDTVLRIRNHPSIGLYCGRNEGYPPLELDTGIRKAIGELHSGIYYTPSSADGPVSGHGPYQAMPTKYYFAERATPKLHSELGMPNIATMDSLRLMMPESSMWPQGRMWGLHDFALRGAQGGRSFRERVEKSYGGARNAAEWVALAQFVNYEGHRAMFEAQARHRMGLLMWMSHPAWPSLVWQTYDYFLNPGAAYFACRKGSEPLHIQWNEATGNVEVVNYNAGGRTGLTAQAEILNLDGARRWERSATVDSREDSVVAAFAVEPPAGLTPVYFIRLKLTRGNEVLSENFYWRGTESGNYRALRELPQAKVEAATRVEASGGRTRLTTELRNASNSPALMVCVKAVREKSGDRILPAIYSDNYVALMPGERRTIVTDVDDADARGERPAIVVEGFNVAAATAQ